MIFSKSSKLPGLHSNHSFINESGTAGLSFVFADVTKNKNFVFLGKIDLYFDASTDKIIPPMLIPTTIKELLLGSLAISFAWISAMSSKVY